MDWRRQEAGWYTSELGGICQEDEGCWYFYSFDGRVTRGPYKTFAEAKRNAQQERTLENAVLL